MTYCNDIILTFIYIMKLLNTKFGAPRENVKTNNLNVNNKKVELLSGTYFHNFMCIKYCISNICEIKSFNVDCFSSHMFFKNTLKKITLKK